MVILNASAPAALDQRAPLPPSLERPQAISEILRRMIRARNALIRMEPKLLEESASELIGTTAYLSTQDRRSTGCTEISSRACDSLRSCVDLFRHQLANGIAPNAEQREQAWTSWATAYGALILWITEDYDARP